MKKALFLTILLALAVYSFAQEIPNRVLFIEGSAVRPAQTEFFLTQFRMEATNAGYTLANARGEAGFIYRFEVTNNPDMQKDGNQFAIRISLINNSNNFEILYFYFYFNTLDEMYEHTQFLLFRAVSVIPPLTEEAIIQAESTWKHKWIYLRASFDYPVNLFRLQSEPWIYDSSLSDKSGIDHKVIVLPGLTLGAEFQFLNFMSFELNFKASMGDFDTNLFFNLSAQAQLKFPIKYFRTFVISPYIAGLYPILVPNKFTSYPLFLVGGGVQINVRGGSSGAFFVDMNVMTSFTDALRFNDFRSGFPLPTTIRYRPIMVGLGIGYKFGLKDRPRRQVRYRFVCDCGCGTEMPSAPVSAPAPTPPSDSGQSSSQERFPQERERRVREPSTRTFYF